ncbi:DUF1624 domain-containing protein [Acidaminobacter sp. JC074]|uniref:DUF1624 domain-containing protein n=1 Tax=Acidaminobacter sp. JC074 TaxID=2530199 RepID=UPI001F0F5CEA|nr:heparan-alpha-glucosaminide N-acetyltransferase domain-containing protein [Acidaminobacter sp. JC074]MCH4888280.1 DUF1624 domain-containing protein [Acidaminobacter sp. JC074]
MRNKTIDMFRGIIMILMALDHASYFIIDTHFYEGYDFITPYPSSLAFMVRWITHLCAPGFFFVLGYSLYHAYQKKKAYKLILRGFFLIFLQVTFINFIWQIDYIYIGVITILGLSMILITLFMPLIKKYGFIIGPLLILMGQYIPESHHLLTGLLLKPGLYGDFYILYTLTTWLGIGILGVFVASLKQIPYLKLSLISFIVFILFSLDKANMKEIFIIVKYPPSIGFIGITLAINFFMMFVIDKYSIYIKSVLIIGKEPLFFYIAHLYLYSLAGSLVESNAYWILFLSYILSLPLLYLMVNLYATACINLQNQYNKYRRRI